MESFQTTRKLSDLNLNKSELSFDEIQTILVEYNLKIMNTLQDRFSFFDALSFYIYKT